MTIVISEEAVNIALNTWLGGVPAWCNDETERLRTEMRAALTAALPHLPQGVGVKKLEWQQDGAGNHRAETPFGNEFVQKWTDIRDGNISYEHEGAYFETVEAAQAAAQADYEARILSALEPSAARELALEEAARNAAMYLATGFITCPRCGEEVETKDTDAEYTLRAALSSQEPSAHRETVLYRAGRKAQKAIAAILASGGLESDKWWDDLVSAQQSLAAAIRSLSSPDHNADAGKVEGDGSAAARDVLAERKRQVEAEGWTPEHDDKHSSGQLAYAASVYALCAASPDADRAVMDEHGSYVSVPFRIRNRWPWDESWLKPTNRRRDLVKAAALILAEIERLDRLPSAPSQEGAGS